MWALSARDVCSSASTSQHRKANTCRFRLAKSNAFPRGHPNRMSTMRSTHRDNLVVVQLKNLTMSTSAKGLLATPCKLSSHKEVGRLFRWINSSIRKPMRRSFTCQGFPKQGPHVKPQDWSHIDSCSLGPREIL